MDADPRINREAALRAAVLRGDEAAWRALYDDAFEPLYRYVLLRAARRHDTAAEVVQDTWCVAVRRIRAFDPRVCAFEAWLKTIAMNLLRNHWRRVAGRSDTSAADLAQAPARAASDAAELIALAMTELPANYQAVLRARYEDHDSLATIGAQAGTSAKAVESLLARARTAFRAAYARLDPDGAR